MFRLTYLLYVGLHCFAVVSTFAISAEFCYQESFSPACQDHETVKIHSARFGRMMPNRCGTGDPNGCTIDVKPDLDKVCGGSQSCNVPVHFNSFSGPDPCLNAAPDSYPWLEVTYECVTALSTEDFCGDEIFSHSCVDNEVLLFRTANYGRMRPSRCASGDNLGCGEDVLSDMDRLCSGRQTCNFPVDQDTFTGSNPCPVVDPDTKLFLEVDYECAKVVTPPADVNCKRDMGIIVKNPDGYLSSYVAQKYNYGTMDCPWRIEVPRGYLLNITLFDFSTPVIANLEDEPPAGCHMYAVLTENHPTARKSYICRGDERVKNVYLSKTNNVKIGLKSGGGLSAVSGDNYLLKLDAVKVR